MSLDNDSLDDAMNSVSGSVRGYCDSFGGPTHSSYLLMAKICLHFQNQAIDDHVTSYCWKVGRRTIHLDIKWTQNKRVKSVLSNKIPRSNQKVDHSQVEENLPVLFDSATLKERHRQLASLTRLHSLNSAFQMKLKLNKSECERSETAKEKRRWHGGGERLMT